MMLRILGLSSFLLLTAHGIVVAQAPRPAACRSVSFAPTSALPGWISSAVYVPGRDRVLTIDSSRNKLLLISSTGQVSKLENDTADRADLPALLAPTANGFLLKLVKSELLVLDSDLNLKSEEAVRMTASAAQAAVGPFYQWTVAGNSVVAYGSIRSPRYPEGYALGFLSLLLPGTGSPETFWPFPHSRFYSLGYQYLASLGKTAYFLALDKTAMLYRMTPGSSPEALPNAVPAAFRTPPTLKTQMQGPADAPALFSELERQTMLAGLYGGPDGYLYLLARRPASPGRTDWLLYQIDPADNKIRGLGHLRSAAKHLTVVPSANAWYFIERGEVTPNGRQDIHSMIVVPSSRFAEMSLAGIDLCP
jgi:hypothetical protein